MKEEKNAALCFSCGKKLTGDDVGMYKRAVDRGAKEFLCLDCLAKKYKTTREYFEEKIKFLKANNCALFN